MHNENKNNPENNILEFEELFKDELKRKKTIDQPKDNKRRYIYAIIYYLLVMFILASIIQIIFLSNEHNIQYYMQDDVVLSDLVNDTNGIAILDTTVYETDYEKNYSNYVDQLGYYDNYSVLVNVNNSFLTNLDDISKQTLATSFIEGTNFYWDLNNEYPITIYISDQLSIYQSLDSQYVHLVSLANKMIDQIVLDEESIGFINKTFYDTYFADYSDQVNVHIDLNYTDYYMIYNLNNTDQTLIESDYYSLQQIFSGTQTLWSNNNLITLYHYTNQDIPTVTIDTPNEATVTYMEWDLTGFANGLINFLVYILILPVIIIILKPNLAYDLEMTKKAEKTKIIGFIITGYVFLIFANFISQLISNGLSSLFNQPIEESVNQIAIESILNSNGAVFVILSAILIGPIVEELIFRKSIFGLIKNQYVALVVSAFVFGAIHLTGETSIVSALINGISYIIMGFVFGIIYIRLQKNIFYPIAVHVLSNLISIIGILITLYT
ncbi:MAG: CPBP family intramembrane glutamic endopeptidase [Acholeplasmataceae bacterium]